MEFEFTFRKSAFQHNLTEADILHAFKTARFMGQYKDREDVIMVLGFDTKANPIEILYNEYGENGVNVFHAMPCQNRFLGMFEGDQTV
jgi:hypothetical protein